MRRRWLLVWLCGGCVPGAEEDVRRPCPGTPDWDPNRPVALRWGDSGLVELNEHVARRISVERVEGGAISGVPFAFPGGLGLCVLGGLPAGADLAWTVTDGSEPRVQEVDTITTQRSGRWSFHTADVGEVAAPRAVADCVNVATTDELYDTQCAEFLDDSAADTAGAR